MRRRFTDIAGEIVEVHAAARNGSLAFEIQGPEGRRFSREARVRRAPRGELLIEVDGIVRTAHVSVCGDEVWITTPTLSGPGGCTIRLRRHEQRRGLRAEAGSSVAAPMTGRVVLVHVVVGDVVAKGEPLVVVEAMKMEQPLPAPRDGVVAAVCCEAGQLVDGGVDLVLLEPHARDPGGGDPAGRAGP